MPVSCIPDVTCYMLGISELRLAEATALIQGNLRYREVIVMLLEEVLRGPLSFELQNEFPGVWVHFYDRKQFAEDIVTEALKYCRAH